MTIHDMVKMELNDWAEINPRDEYAPIVYILRVPGGWLYRTHSITNNNQTFVPIPKTMGEIV